MQFHLPELQRRVDLGLISCRKHPRFDLWIYNYTKECQFSLGNWDYYTQHARGLILDEHGAAVAVPFQKFFNLNESPDVAPEALPQEWPEVSSKEDGSLGIGFYNPDGQYEIATRGTFESEQSQWATAWWSQNGSRSLRDSWTYLFEIIYLANTYVVDYKGWSGLILIGLVDTQTGQTEPYAQVIAEGQRLGLRTPVMYAMNIAELLAAAEHEQSGIEGWVLRYSNGLMVKVKTEQYRAIFRALVGLSTRSLWEALSAGQELTIPAGARDDIAQAIARETANFKAQYQTKLIQAQHIFDSRPKVGRRKDVALFFLEQARELSSVLFAMLDGKDHQKAIWKLLEPQTSTHIAPIVASQDEEAS